MNIIYHCFLHLTMTNKLPHIAILRINYKWRRYTFSYDEWVCPNVDYSSQLLVTLVYMLVAQPFVLTSPWPRSWTHTCALWERPQVICWLAPGLCLRCLCLIRRQCKFTRKGVRHKIYRNLDIEKKVYLTRGSFMEESEAVVNTFQDLTCMRRHA